MSNVSTQPIDRTQQAIAWLSSVIGRTPSPAQPGLGDIARLARAATPGLYKSCGHNRGGCSCGMVWSLYADAPLATMTVGEWGNECPTVVMVDDGNGTMVPEARIIKEVYGSFPRGMGEANAAYFGALGPQTVLRLVAWARAGQVAAIGLAVGVTGFVAYLLMHVTAW